MNKMPALPLALAGLGSGALYALWLLYGTEKIGKIGQAGSVLDLISHQVGAGIFYGVIVGAVLRRELRFEIWRWAVWIVGAGLCYGAAYRMAIHLYDSPTDATAINFLVGAAAGAVGGALLCAVSAALFTALRSKRAALFGTVAGGAVGLALPLAVESSGPWPWVLFYAAWQGAYAVASTRT